MTLTAGLFDLRPGSGSGPGPGSGAGSALPSARAARPAPSARPARPARVARPGRRPDPEGDVPSAAASGAERRPATPGPPPSRTVVQLLGAAREELRAAQEAADPGERFSSAHLSALRAAAAVLALRARSRRTARPTDAWSLLASVAPEYAEWAGFFGAHSATRSAVEAGVRGRVSQRDADDMVRQADLFLALVTRTVAGRGR